MLVAQLVESTCNVGDLDSIQVGKIPWRREYPLQYSSLENFMDRIVHRVTESDMTERLSLHFNKDLLYLLKNF